ncbi:DUF4012 domain-containing protein [Candidatus Gottesmanbacteria bacterium]|nr:DUF4012 domain-containing protein [Candidatus Gottesmanbacteria bacterium]
MIDGFKKIELEQVSPEMKLPQHSQKFQNISKAFGGVIVAVLVLLLVFILLIILPAKDIYNSAQKTVRVAKEAGTFLKNQDLDSSLNKLKELKDNLDILKNNINRLTLLKYIPFVGNYESDSQHMVNAGIAGVEAAQITVDTLIPYADLLGLKGKSTFVAGSADDRIKMAVETLDKVTPKLSEISQKIEIAGKELSEIDPQRYPEKIGSMTIKSRLQSAKNIFTDTAQLFVEAQPLLAKIPQLLGNKEPKMYLVLFQNDAELRATGGFITAYGVFKVDHGKMQVIKAEDIYKLDESKKKKLPAPDPILKYHQNVYTYELRDSNLSPDYIVSMKEFESKLAELVPDFPKYDGIIAVDTHVLVSAIKVLGDFNIYGRTFSAENDKRCDCPKAIYELEDYSTKPVAYVREERKDIISALLYQILQRSLGVSPSKYWGKLFQMFLDEAKQKHALFYFHDEDAQKGIEALNFAGRLSPTEGDYLYISNVNFAGAKSNLFVRPYVKQEINVDGDGSIKKTLTITYKNPAPPSNCNLEAGQLCLNGILRNWLRVYVPKGSALMEFKGSEKDTVTYDELGKTVFEGFLTVKPQGASEVKISYKLPFKKAENGIYNLIVQKQPGTDEDEYSVYLGSKQVDQFKLLTDKKVTFKM